jgi:hypothetical protein
MAYKISLKTYFLDSSLPFPQQNLDVVSDGHREHFHQEVSAIKKKMEKVTKNLRGELCAGTDEKPVHVIKQCIENTKKTFGSHVYKTSLQSDRPAFPDRLN